VITVSLPAVVTYRGSRLIRGDPFHWGIFYSEWVVNVLARFIADAHHRGLLWRLPVRVVENIPLIGLDYLLEGSAYQRQVIEQLLRLQAECDWDSWARRGYGSVGAVPIHLVGSKHRIHELSSLEHIPCAETPMGSMEEVVEEVIAYGRVRSPQVAVGGGAPILPREGADSPVLVMGGDGLEPVLPREAMPGSPVLVIDDGQPGEGGLSPARRGSLSGGQSYPGLGSRPYGVSPLIPGMRRASDLENSAGDRRVLTGGEKSGPRNFLSPHWR
jgi:hypothetical protein